MTKEEKKQVLDRALELAFKEIENTKGPDMGTPEFKALIENISNMEWLYDRYCPISFPGIDTVEAVREAAPAEEPAPVPATNPKTEPSISKDELRNKLATYSNEHEKLDIAQIMSGMGYSKLSEVPPDRYTELLQLVEAAIGVN